MDLVPAREIHYFGCPFFRGCRRWPWPKGSPLLFGGFSKGAGSGAGLQHLFVHACFRADGSSWTTRSTYCVFAYGLFPGWLKCNPSNHTKLLPGGGGGRLRSSQDANYPPLPLGGIWPTVSCQRCRPQASMGAKGARRSMDTKGALRKIWSTLHPNTILKPNLDSDTHPQPSAYSSPST